MPDLRQEIKVSGILNVANLTAVAKYLKSHPGYSITPDHVIVTNSEGGPLTMKPTHKALRKQMLREINKKMDELAKEEWGATATSYSRGFHSGLRCARSIVAIAFRDYDLAKQAAKKAPPKATVGVVNNFRTHPRATPAEWRYDNAPKPDKTVIVKIPVDTGPLVSDLKKASETLARSFMDAAIRSSEVQSQLAKIGALMNKPVTIPVNLGYRSPQPKARHGCRIVSEQEFNWANEGMMKGYKGSPVEVFASSDGTPTGTVYEVSTQRIP